MDKYIKSRYIAAGFTLLAVMGCSTSGKSYTQGFGYSKTIYKISRDRDTIMPRKAENKGKIWGKIIEGYTKEPWYDFRKISLKNLATDTLYLAFPDLNGAYDILVNPGIYSISFTPATHGEIYRTVQKDSILTIQPGDQRLIDFIITKERIETDGIRVYKNKREYKKAQHGQ